MTAVQSQDDFEKDVDVNEYVLCILPRNAYVQIVLSPYQSFILPAKSSTRFNVCQDPVPKRFQQVLKLLN
jgi:hypothetical protein